MVSPRLALRRAQSEVLVRLLQRRGVNIGAAVRFIGPPVIEIAGGSVISIGDRGRFISDSAFATLGAAHPVVLRTMRHGAVLRIGTDVGITAGAICAARSVSIGDGTILGANVTVADTDFHPLDSHARRYAELPEPLDGDEVVIGRNVFIGAGAIVLKGARIGDHSVIGAGSVVLGNIPASVIAAGVPAKVLRTINVD